MGNKLFTTIPAPKVKRNTFNLSNQVSLTMGFNKLYPTRILETIPGDLMSISAEAFSRLQPMIAPVMNSMRISNHAFYVPLRTLNNHFAEFMFNNKAGDYDKVLPYTTTQQLLHPLYSIYLWYNDEKTAAAYEASEPGRIDFTYNYVMFLRYMGIPYDFSAFDAQTPNTLDGRFLAIATFYDDNTNIIANVRVNLLPFFAVQKVWNEYYRDENLVDDIFDEFNSVLASSHENDGVVWSCFEDWSGDVSDELFDTDSDVWVAWAKLMQLRPRAWAHDRYTSALPFAQRGPDVSIPMELGNSPVKFDGSKTYGYLPTAEGQAGKFRGNTKTNTHTYGLALTEDTFEGYQTVLHRPVTASPQLGSPLDADETIQASYDPGDTLYADNSQSLITSTIRDFRRALRLQQWYENSSRGGYRPNEATLAHFGVSIPDASLQRAEFLGGCTSPLVVSEVPQTSESSTTPQGTLAGKATSYSAHHLFKHFFTEHGFVVIMTSCLCRANYFQGLDRMYSRMTRDEYAWPEFANLGEEPVYTKELFAQNTAVAENTIFGYVPRYSDYKCAVNKLLGQFTTSLKFWVQPREFDPTTPPQLNEQFIYDASPLDPFAVRDGSDVVLSTINFGVKASRLLPFYGTPTL